MAREKIQIDLEAKDNASGKIDKVADKAEALEKVDPTVKVDADTSAAESALGGLGDIVDTKFGVPLQGARTALAGPAGIAGGAALAGAALFGAANNAADAAVEANALKEAVGGTIEETSRLLAATGRVGLRYNDVLELIAESNNAMTENADLARQLGVNLEGTPIERFQSLVDLVYQIPDPLERSRVASKFFGEEGSKQLPKLIGLYGNLSNALDSVSDREVFGEEDVEEALQFKQNLADIQGTIAGIGLEFGKAVTPLVNFFTEGLAQSEKLRAELGGDDGPLGLFESLPQLPGLTAGRKAIEGFFGSIIGGSEDAAEAITVSAHEVSASEEQMARALLNAADTSERTAEQQAVVAESARAMGDAWAQAEGTVAEAAEAGAQAIRDQEAAVTALNDAYREGMALSGDVDRANDAFLDGLAELDTKLQEATDSATDEADAQRNRGLVVRDSMDDGIALAKILADQTIQLRESGGAALTAGEKQKIHNDELLKVAQTADGPVRDALLHHIASIEAIPEDVATAIAAEIAEGDLAEAQRLLDEATRDRTAPIAPELVGEQTFENELAHLTRERQMQIRGILSGTVPLEGDSLHLTDLETGQESGVIPHYMEMEIDVGGNALVKIAESRAALEAAKQAARDAGVDFTSSLDILEQALSDLSLARSVDAISQEEYIDHLEAHLAGYERFSLEWFEITKELTRVQGEAAKEQQRIAEEAAREQQRIAEEALRERQQLVDSVRGQFTGADDLVSEFAGEEGVTARGIVQFLQQEAATGAEFQHLIEALRKTRLNPQVIEALGQAGPDAIVVARALAAAHPSHIEQINRALASLFTTGGITAAQVGRALGIPGFQQGGIFHAPSGGAGLAVLHDGERVIPAGKAGGDTFHQTFTINTRQDVTSTIRQLRDYQRHNGEVRIS